MISVKRKTKIPKISFGIIVLNGEPFTRYCLRSLYPFAHQIIVVEGACKGARNISTKEGHSIDGTLEILKEFKRKEDPANKITIITAETDGYSDGFWPGEKNEMSRAYAKRSTGDYLWQVDIDEFYKKKDMKYIIEMLRKDSSISMVSFKQITFWGSVKYKVDGWLFRSEFAKFWAQRYSRLFKWGKNYKYATHRPPTVFNDKGEDLRTLKWEKGDFLIKKNIFLYHYSLLFPKQVFEKCEYYKSSDWSKRKKAIKWAKEIFMKLKNPYRVHNVYQYPGWLEYYEGDHPEQIQNMMNDIKKGKLNIRLRDNKDVERLLKSLSYKFGVFLLRGIGYLFGQINKILKIIID